MRRTVILLFSGNFLSKILGLIREVLTAALFGTGEAIAAYRIAQTGTLTPVNFFTSDSLNSAFIPLYKFFRGISTDKAQIFLWSQLALFSLVSVLLSLGLLYGGAGWVSVLAPELAPDVGHLATVMLQIMGLGVPFYLMSAILMFLAMARDDFVPMAVRPVIQNVGLIGGTLVAYWKSNVMWFALGFTVAYAAFFVWLVIRALRAGWLAWPVQWSSLELREVLASFWRTLKPLLLLPFMLQGSIVVERLVASLISLVAVAALDYARFVTETLLLLISVPIGFAGLAHWSGLDDASLRERLGRTMALAFLIALPISCFVAAHADVVVRVIYMRGAFDAESARVTADILCGISIGLWAQVVGYVLIKAMNARMRSRAVFAVMAVALLANAVVNIAGYRFWGALTLGLGNAAYGVLLLVGGIASMKLWRECWHGLRALVPCAAIYMLIARLLPEFSNPWWELLVAGACATLFWALCVIVLPELRGRFYGLLKREGRTLL